ncbi:major facilitator superfamily domain-containing protein [Xylariaceae sp. FL0804]|nr:major facilitator superfamily domain-containing protein [Xylariaceae sp. FL0804]
MSPTEDVSLRQLPPADVHGPSSHHFHEDTANLEAADWRQWESTRKRAYILLGASISQLPIWGFAMCYGVFQEYYYDNWTLEGARDVTGIIGTTSNGVTYLSMPFLFALFTKRWASKRQTAALVGAVIMCASFILSSFSTHVWHLVATQGVMAALGCALVYSPLTLSLGEWFNTGNRAVAYGVTLSCKNIVGAVCPFMLRALLDRFGFRTTLRIWTAVALGSSTLAILLIPTPPSSLASDMPRRRKIPWQFLRHRTFYIYSIAIILQSAGYGIPQTYLSTYAREVTRSSQTSATLLLTLFNLPGIIASSLFGYLIDNKHARLSATTMTSISAGSSALAAFLLWGLTSPGSGMALLVLFSMTFGFFAGGYSASWGAMLKELEGEASQRNEAIDSGMVYGLLNGARGLGYVSGGLASVPLLSAGRTTTPMGVFGYGSAYGPLIIFTGLSSVFGGWGLLWKWDRLMRLL